MEQYDKRVDDYIANSTDFSRPILIHLRELVHRAAPEMNETMKWSCPFFDFQGPVCQMAAFKQHCAFGFWKAGIMKDPYHLLNKQAETAGSFGRITSLSDLPNDDILIQYIQQALYLNLSGIKVPSRAKVDTVKSDLAIPQFFSEALEGNPMTKVNFDKFSASQKKEYVVWLEDAKTEPTRMKRLETALQWIAESKSRHWKYK